MPQFIFHNRLVRLSDAEGALLLVLSDPQHRQRYVGGWSVEENELLGQLIYRRFIKVSLHGTMYALRPKGFAYLEQREHSVLDPLLAEAFEAGRTSRLGATMLADLAEAIVEYGRLVRARYSDFSRGLRQQLIRQYALGLGQRSQRQEPNPSSAGHTLPFPSRERLPEPTVLLDDSSARLSGSQDSGSILADVIDLEADALPDDIQRVVVSNLDTDTPLRPRNASDPEVHYDLEATRRLAERLRTL